MDLNEYQKMCRVTAKECENGELEICNWGLGLAGEAGDVASCIKKVVFHQNEAVKDGIKENIGDMMWYTAMICNFYGWKLEDCLQKNIDKLKLRYPDGFTFEGARREGTMTKWSGKDSEIKVVGNING